MWYKHRCRECKRLWYSITPDDYPNCPYCQCGHAQVTGPCEREQWRPKR
jgi:RNA polymerase subunit RPABC4/transcription elongation factor Spt4